MSGKSRLSIRVVGEAVSGTGGCWSWVFLNNGVLASNIIYGCVCVIFRVIVLLDLFNTTCLYDIILGGTKLLSVDFNKIFLLLFVATFVTLSHRHSVHP